MPAMMEPESAAKAPAAGFFKKDEDGDYPATSDHRQAIVNYTDGKAVVMKNVKESARGSMDDPFQMSSDLSGEITIQRNVATPPNRDEQVYMSLQ